MMKHKSMQYFAVVNNAKSPGVVNKINNTVQGAQLIGLEASSFIFPTTFTGITLFLKELKKASADVIFIRFSDLIFPIVFFLMIFLRIKRKKIIIDVPTPRSTAIKEMDITVTNPIKRYARQLLSYISWSWILFPANTIVQYADENWWFSFGLRRKTLKIGNGILIDENVKITKSVWPSHEINLIAVAQLADWHGYDRLLHAVSQYNQVNTTPYKINLKIVGEGDTFHYLKTLSDKLNLKNITFTGMLTGEALNSSFDNIHVGVASLGLFRIGLKEASVLKTREYMSRGLAVIATGSDPDFNEDCLFRLVVKNEEEINSIVDVLFSLPKKLDFINNAQVRTYAEDKLTINSKIISILNHES